VPQKLDIARDVPITGLDFLRARPSLARSQRDLIPRSFESVGLPLEIAGEAIAKLSGGQFQRFNSAFVSTLISVSEVSGTAAPVGSMMCPTKAGIDVRLRHASDRSDR
jgi:hypothetical protein